MCIDVKEKFPMGICWGMTAEYFPKWNSGISVTWVI